MSDEAGQTAQDIIEGILGCSVAEINPNDIPQSVESILRDQQARGMEMLRDHLLTELGSRYPAGAELCRAEVGSFIDGGTSLDFIAAHRNATQQGPQTFASPDWDTPKLVSEGSIMACHFQGRVMTPEEAIVILLRQRDTARKGTEGERGHKTLDTVGESASTGTPQEDEDLQAPSPGVCVWRPRHIANVFGWIWETACGERFFTLHEGACTTCGKPIRTERGR